MDSLALTRPSILSPFVPFLAVLTRDLRMSLRHWALWAWLIVSALTITMLIVEVNHAAATVVTAKIPVAPISEETAEQLTTAESHFQRLLPASVFVGKMLRFQLFFGITFALILAATSLPTEADIASEAILSRGIARAHYFIAKLVSRVIMVVLCLTVIAAVGATVGMSKMQNDIEWMGWLQVGGSFLILFAATAVFGYAISGWFRNALVCIAVVWMFVYGIGIVSSVLEVPLVSPTIWAEQIPIALRTAESYRPHNLSIAAALIASIISAVSLLSYTSKDV